MSEALLAGAIDAALVARAQQGETIAFEVLVVKYQRRIAATIRRFVQDDQITEELTQEVFLSAFLALTTFMPDGDFAAWLFTIARNSAKSYLRSAQNRQDDRPLPVPVDVLVHLHQAGLSAGDVLVALDGLRVTASNLETLLKRYRTGDAIAVLAFRRDELMAFTVIAKPDVAPQFVLESQAKPVAAVRLRTAWLRKR